MSERESFGRERPKIVSDIKFDSRDGLIYWQAEYDDGSFSEPESTGLTTDSRPAALEGFRTRKMQELGGDQRIAA